MCRVESMCDFGDLRVPSHYSRSIKEEQGELYVLLEEFIENYLLAHGPIWLDVDAQSALYVAESLRDHLGEVTYVQEGPVRYHAVQGLLEQEIREMIEKEVESYEEGA